MMKVNIAELWAIRDCFDYELESNPIFLSRIERARTEFRAGKSIPIEDIRAELAAEET